MAKAKSVFVCSSCGTRHEKWQGRCKGCGEWNTLLEEINDPGRKVTPAAIQITPSVPKRLDEIETGPGIRLQTADEELNRVLGGGIVPGSLILLGGEPGIGKSTLLLQLSMQLSGLPVLYVSGEESEAQIRMRAERLPGGNPDLWILNENQLEPVLEYVQKIQPSVWVVDSIQTLYTSALEAAPGTVSQVRECAGKIMQFSKSTGIPVFLVGHITKDGSLAGPKVLEHIVDTVLAFEGDRHHQYRIVRTLKNRFGSTLDLGIYEMQASGLKPVSNPSGIFLSPSAGQNPGVAVGATLEGSRPFLLEVQALVSTTSYGNAQRSATGYDSRRLHMLLAVLEKRCGFKLGDKDVFLNITGGIKTEDPALDLAVCLAIVSSLHDIPIGKETVFAAEVGLTGEVRPVNRIDQRIGEADKLGFTRFYAAGPLKSVKSGGGMEVHAFIKIQEIFASVFS